MPIEFRSGRYYYNSGLDNVDWEKILALPWRHREQEMLNLIRERGNYPLPRRLFKQVGNKVNDFCYGYTNIQSTLKKAGLPYRMKQVSQYSWDYALFKIEPVRK